MTSNSSGGRTRRNSEQLQMFQKPLLSMNSENFLAFTRNISVARKSFRLENPAMEDENLSEEFPETVSTNLPSNDSTSYWWQLPYKTSFFLLCLAIFISILTTDLRPITAAFHLAKNETNLMAIASVLNNVITSCLGVFTTTYGILTIQKNLSTEDVSVLQRELTDLDIENDYQYFSHDQLYQTNDYAKWFRNEFCQQSSFNDQGR